MVAIEKDTVILVSLPTVLSPIKYYNLNILKTKLIFCNVLDFNYGVIIMSVYFYSIICSDYSKTLAIILLGLMFKLKGFFT